MTSSQDENSADDSWRSYNWVSSKSFAATPFYMRAWEILKQDWLVFVWKLVADFLQRAFTFVFGLLLVALVAIHLQLYLADGGTPFGWVDHLILTLQSPTFIAGIFGAVFFVTLLGTALQALIVGGIWGLIDVGLRREPIQRWTTFWSQAIARFPQVLALYLLRFAFGVINTFLAAGLLLTFYHAATVGRLAAATQWQLVLLLSGSVTFLVAWTGLSRLVLEAASAPLIVDDVDLGESILRGAYFVLDNFWSLYRLIIFALGVLLIPLGIYWAAIMFDNLMLLMPALAPLGTFVQLIGQLFLSVSVTVVGIFFYGALFAFYHHDDQAYARDQADSDDENAEDLGIFRQGTSLDDFLPDNSPHRFDIADVLPRDPDESESVDDS